MEGHCFVYFSFSEKNSTRLLLSGSRVPLCRCLIITFLLPNSKYTLNLFFFPLYYRSVGLPLWSVARSQGPVGGVRRFEKWESTSEEEEGREMLQYCDVAMLRFSSRRNALIIV